MTVKHQHAALCMSPLRLLGLLFEEMLSRVFPLLCLLTYVGETGLVIEPGGVQPVWDMLYLESLEAINDGNRLTLRLFI